MVSSVLTAFLAEQAAAKKPFPLFALLTIYQNSHRRDTYCEYMEGFKLLVHWLSPIAIPQYLPNEIRAIPKLCGSYEINEIARILGTTPNVIYTCLMERIETSK